MSSKKIDSGEVSNLCEECVFVRTLFVMVCLLDGVCVLVLKAASLRGW